MLSVSYDFIEIDLPKRRGYRVTRPKISEYLVRTVLVQSPSET